MKHMRELCWHSSSGKSFPSCGSDLLCVRGGSCLHWAGGTVLRGKQRPPHAVLPVCQTPPGGRCVTDAWSLSVLRSLRPASPAGLKLWEWRSPPPGAFQAFHWTRGMQEAPLTAQAQEQSQSMWRSNTLRCAPTPGHCSHWSKSICKGLEEVLKYGCSLLQISSEHWEAETHCDHVLFFVFFCIWGPGWIVTMSGWCSSGLEPVWAGCTYSNTLANTVAIDDLD